jgi:ubiquitin-protein ligase
MTIRIPAGLLASTSGGEARFAEERQRLSTYFRRFSLSREYGDGNWAVASGRLTTFVERSYQIRIDLPRGYPHACPVIAPIGWQPIKNPHLYQDGTICVMMPAQWTSFMTCAFMVAKTAIWLNKYEIWLDKRIWPGNEQHSHGVFYGLRKMWHGL